MAQINEYLRPAASGCVRIVVQSGKDDSGGLLDDFQTLGQQGSIAVVQVDAVGGGAAHR